MRLALTATAAAFAALLGAPAPIALAQSAEDPGVTARQIHEGCVRRREDARVCACGVGVAYAKLEPAAFALIPKIDPLIDEPDRARQIGGLLTVASQSRMTPQQVQSAYETIRANRAVVRQVCAPLAQSRAR
jgi:hypothetical protein